MGALGNTPRSQTVLRLEARKSFAFGLQFKLKSDETPIDLTGATVRLVLAKQPYAGGDVLFTKTATLLDAELGLAQFELQALDLDLAEGEYPFAVTLVSALGYSTPIMKGVFDVAENADPSTAGTYAGVNPTTNLAAYLEGGDLVSVEVASIDGLAAVVQGMITSFSDDVDTQVAAFTAAANAILAETDALQLEADSSAQTAVAAAEAAAAAATAAAASADLAASITLQDVDPTLAYAINDEGSETHGAVVDQVSTLTPELVAELDADAGSAFRVQQDARLSATYAPKWKASTAYALGATVLAPDGSLVKAKAAFTSGATYSAANWTSVATYAGAQAQTELAATFTRADWPVWADAANRPNRYDSTRLTYNLKPSNTRNLRAGLARAKAGTSSVRIAFGPADSTSAGYPGSASTASPAARFIKGAEALGFPILGTGPVIANPGGGPGGYMDARYTTTGTWTPQASNPNGILQSNVVGSTITFTSDRPGTQIEFCYLGLGAGFTYQVDGGAGVAVTDASTGALARKVISGLANTTHTLKITVDSIPGGGAFYLAWVDVRVGGGYGLSVGNFGVCATTTANWLNTNFYFPNPVLKNWAPEVCFLDLGINDNGGAVSTATFKANTASLISQYQAINADVILVTSNYTDAADMTTYKANKRAYDQAKYELADTYNVPLIDFAVLMDDYVSDNSRGLHADQVHPSAAGYSLKADLLLGLLRQ